MTEPTDRVQINPVPHRARRPGRALLLVVALFTAGCFGSGGAKKPVVEGDREMLSAAATAQQAFARGAYDVAAQHYRRALSRARLQDDPVLIGDQAYNLGVCLMAMGQWDEAQAKLAEAEAALRAAGLPLADVLLVQARLAYRRGDMSNPAVRDAVREAARRVLDDPQSKPSPTHQSQVTYVLIDLACDANDAPAAAALLNVELARGSTDASAALFHATGRVRLLEGDPAAAGAAFDRAATLQRQAHRYAEMSKSLLRAAEAYARASQPEVASDRYYRAARTLAAQEKSPQATSALDAAAALTRDDAMRGQIASLRGELRVAGTGSDEVRSTTQPASAVRP